MYISLRNLIGDNGIEMWNECLVLLPTPLPLPQKEDN